MHLSFYTPRGFGAGGERDVEQRLRELEDALTQLQEQLGFILSNLDDTNFNETFLREWKEELEQAAAAGAQLSGTSAGTSAASGGTSAGETENAGGETE